MKLIKPDASQFTSLDKSLSSKEGSRLCKGSSDDAGIDIKGNRRTDYVAVSNALMGLLLLMVGALSMLLALLSNLVVILVFSLLRMIGVWLAQTLPDVQVQTDEES